MIKLKFRYLTIVVFLFAVQLFESLGGVAAKFVTLNDMAWMRGRRATIKHDISQYMRRNDLQSHYDSKRLAVFIPFPYDMKHSQLNALHCSLTKLLKHVAQTTNTAVYLFVHESTLSGMKSWLSEKFPRVSALPIDKESWVNPSWFTNVTASPYVEAPPVDPYLLSQWKLTFAPDLAKGLGFKFLMIVESDSMFMKSVDFNIVQHFSTGQIAFAYRHKTYKASEKSVAGLAELAKFWMITRNILAPPGTLYEHFNPSDIFHVDTASWDRHIYQDPFVVINLDFWYEEPVQNFLHLVFTSGGELLRLWRSQAVFTMIRLLFLQDTQVHAFHQSTVLYDPIVDDRLYKYMECKVIADADADEVAVSGASMGALMGASMGAPSVVTAQMEQQGESTVAPLVVRAASTIAVELPIMLQSAGVEVLPPQERLRELFLFHWEFSPHSCGADTPLINDYAQYLAEAEARYLRANLWWHTQRVDAQLESLIANEVYASTVNAHHSNNISDASNPEGSAASEQHSTSDSVSRELCKGILKQQLTAFVRFFCSYSFQGRKMVGYEDGLLRAALTHFNTVWS